MTMKQAFNIFGVRYYDSKTLCWLTPDPLGDIDGPNLYTYVLNNPHSYIDPDGRFVIFAIPIMFEFFTISWGACGVVTAFITSEAVVASCIGAALGTAVYHSTKKLDEVVNGESTEDKKKKNRDPKYPGSQSDLEKNPDWSDTTHPSQSQGGRHREFTNGKTGEKIRFDKGDPSQPGHKANDHYHRYNPSSRMGNKDRYLDANGNPTARNSEASHLYP